ncbi:Clp protease ClpP [Duganella sp. FT92W]|uniref:ATP-dependent Clp protease proteolytic subunit n=2 Tax=Pseudoduganella rivuli TaxID=2666085 RepID=A0A7X2LRK8_9BURK|nr:Clp protease ClpP [Pseudoduganella rivuli]
MRPVAAGRVLSAANEKRLREARDSLDSVLSQLTEDGGEEAAHARHVARAALKPGRVRIAAATAAREAELLIYGDIGYGWYDEGITAASITQEIAELDVDTLHVRINSGGGLVFEGIAIYYALVRHPAEVIVHIDGIAASIASVIAMAGDTIQISEGAHLMIHKPWSFAMGDANSMRKEADILDKLEAGLVDIYAARTEADRDELQQWVEAETWFLGQEAVDAGFADEMVPAKKKKAANSGLFNQFKKTPGNLLAGIDVPDVRSFEEFLREAEGLSCAQAKRIAAKASHRLNREDSPKPEKGPLRDVGGQNKGAVQEEAATRLAQRIKQFTSQIKE